MQSAVQVGAGGGFVGAIDGFGVCFVVVGCVGFWVGLGVTFGVVTADAFIAPIMLSNRVVGVDSST